MKKEKKNPKEKPEVVHLEVINIKKEKLNKIYSLFPSLLLLRIGSGDTPGCGVCIFLAVCAYWAALFPESYNPLIKLWYLHIHS